MITLTDNAVAAEPAEGLRIMIQAGVKAFVDAGSQPGDVTESGSSGFVFANPNAREIGNPSSMHGFGASVGAAVKETRRQVQALIGAECDHEIAFTSGGTESDNAAILSALDGVAGVGRSHPSSSVLEDRIGSMISALRRQVTIGAQAGNARVDELIGNCQ